MLKFKEIYLLNDKKVYICREILNLWLVFPSFEQVHNTQFNYYSFTLKFVNYD